MHERQRAGGLRRLRAAEGRCVPAGRVVAWEGPRAPGLSPEPRQAGSPAPRPGRSLPLDPESVGGVAPGARPPGLPLRTHLRRWSRGSSPCPQPGSRAPVRAATAEQGRDGRHDPEGRAGRGAARAAGGRAHSRAPCAPPAPGSLPAPKSAVRPFFTHPLQPRPGPSRLALSGAPSLPRLSFNGRRGSGGSSSPLGAELLARRGGRRSQEPAGHPRAPPVAADLEGPTSLVGGLRTTELTWRPKGSLAVTLGRLGFFVYQAGLTALTELFWGNDERRKWMQALSHTKAGYHGQRWLVCRPRKHCMPGPVLI